MTALIDNFHGNGVAAKASGHPTTKLAKSTSHNAIDAKEASLDDFLVVHSDPGAQYRGQSRHCLTAKYGTGRSMPKGGSPDNSGYEGFFGRMKKDMYHEKTWEKTQEFENAIGTQSNFITIIELKSASHGNSMPRYSPRPCPTALQHHHL